MSQRKKRRVSLFKPTATFTTGAGGKRGKGVPAVADDEDGGTPMAQRAQSFRVRRTPMWPPSNTLSTHLRALADALDSAPCRRWRLFGADLNAEVTCRTPTAESGCAFGRCGGEILSLAA